MRKRSCNALLAGQTLTDEYLNTLKSEMPELHRLFTALAAGYTPNFLDIIGAISEMVAFYTNCDTNNDALDLWLIDMSEKKCRNCS